MNIKVGGHRPRPARLASAGVLLSMLGIVTLAACSSGGGTASATGTSTTSTAYSKALAYADCIRKHGIPNYPDPNSQGQFVIPNGGADPAAGVSAATRDAATKACQSLLPPSMALNPSQAAGNVNSQVKFSQCMRSHGEPNFPDPAANGSITLPSGMNPQSTQFQNAEKACQSLMPQNPGGQAPGGATP